MRARCGRQRKPAPVIAHETGTGGFGSAVRPNQLQCGGDCPVGTAAIASISKR